MGKLVILKLGDGNFEEGFNVIMQLGEDGQLFSLEITGKLPPDPEIYKYYNGWATSYESLGLQSRLEKPAAQVKNVSLKDIKTNCLNNASILRDRFNHWLRSESFSPIREKLLEQLMPLDEVRLIIQTENIWLRKLPWHLWDLCDRYSKIEIAISALNVQKGSLLQNSATNKVKILAIIGNSTGINIQTDRLLLEQLPNAQVSFLLEPQRQQLTDELWHQDWDIFFFAGHSSSQDNCDTGRMFINKTDTLTIEDLKNSLKKAVERGLKIAIFNSCDGLGLARNLADLQIPQIIVMREPVPDKIAQEFLKYFLEAFARGESFYLAVREARERLEALEDKFPCATWLPMICQNPTVLPPTWQDLFDKGEISDSTATASNSNFYLDTTSISSRKNEQQETPRFRLNLATVFAASIAVTSLIMGIRYLGIFQSLELQAFDYLMRNRPAEAPDSRLLIVKVTQEDIEAQGQEPRRGSLSDRTLEQLLQKLDSYQPRAIGLDIYRDFPVQPERQNLARLMAKSDRFVAVCKVTNQSNVDEDPGILPPPEVPRERLGFSDLVVDPDGILRRHLLAMTPPPASRCTSPYALSSQLAFRYLEAEGISPEFTPERNLKLGDTVFKRLKTRTGGYQHLDAAGHQVLLNYRSHRSAQDFAGQVTVTEVLNGQLNPDMVQNRVVLIGITAPSVKDYFFTPYSEGKTYYQQMPGVVAHAQMVSQILSAVLDGRQLLWVWPWWGETLWIWSWSLLGGLLFWRFPLFVRLGLVAIALSLLNVLCFVLLIQDGWLPLIPSALALVFTGSSVVAYAELKTQRS